MDIPSGSKPVSFSTAIKDAHMRIDYLTRICRELVLESEPDRRRHLEDLLQVATRHGMDEGSVDV